MTAITAVFIIFLPFAWIFIDAHIIAKITWSILGILNIIVTYSTYTNYKKHHNVEFFFKKRFDIYVIRIRYNVFSPFNYFTDKRVLIKKLLKFQS